MFNCSFFILYIPIIYILFITGDLNRFTSTSDGSDSSLGLDVKIAREIESDLWFI